MGSLNGQHSTLEVGVQMLRSCSSGLRCSNLFLMHTIVLKIGSDRPIELVKPVIGHDHGPVWCRNLPLQELELNRRTGQKSDNRTNPGPGRFSPQQQEFIPKC
ncbi:hypothetical protein PIB30_032147 [Stylosanthes scabra]|uniref:Uncharacterized protein n=1 Tax=Stylosanthes scabra TaxID=79078 RepID=A0ABU6XD11_9FABA|nr:hypothetical protein [Stylosanthes scabra]